MPAVEPEIDLVRLTREEWESIRAAAAERDLVRGGRCRVLPAGVRFFCSPENAPPGWSGGYEQGSPDLPRGVVGEAEVFETAGENHLLVRLAVTNWAAYRRAGGREYPGAVLAQEAALRGTAPEREWLRREFDDLRSAARGGRLGPRHGE